VGFGVGHQIYDTPIDGVAKIFCNAFEFEVVDHYKISRKWRLSSKRETKLQ
jgi:hypothetical protein